MKTIFRKSFERDLKKLKRSRQVLNRIHQKLTEVEAADDLQEVTSSKKLSGGENYYRIRVVDYRIGITGHPNHVFLSVACTDGISIATFPENIIHLPASC